MSGRSPETVPRVSILMPVYNALPFLREAVDSMLTQTMGDFELVAIDDGSTDGTEPVLQQYAEADARVIHLRIERGGIVAALNAGLSRCRAEVVARMDADDRSLPDRLSRQLAFLEQHPEVVVVGCAQRRMDEAGRPICRRPSVLGHDSIEAQMLRGQAGVLHHPTAMMRLAAVREAGGYREQYRHAEDLDLFLRMAEIGQLANLPDELYEARMHLGSVTRTESQRHLRELKRQIVAETRQRRGLGGGQVELDLPERDYDEAAHRLKWAWRALGDLHPRTARHHAWKVARSRPTSARAWGILAGSMLPTSVMGKLRDRRRQKLSPAASRQGGVGPVNLGAGAAGS